MRRQGQEGSRLEVGATGSDSQYGCYESKDLDSKERRETHLDEPDSDEVRARGGENLNWTRSPSRHHVRPGILICDAEI
jgi:hypothetical protein